MVNELTNPAAATAAPLANNIEFQRMLADVLRWPADDAPRIRLAAWLRLEGHPFGAWMRGLLAGQHAHFIPMPSTAEQDELPGADFMPSLAEVTGATGFYSSRVAGLIGGIVCTEASFIKHARTIFSHYPILMVQLANRKVWVTKDAEGDTTHVLWNGFERDTQYGPVASLDMHIAERLTGYTRCRTGSRRGITRWEFPTENAAVAALSRACIAYGRSVVGLPALPTVKEVGSLQTY